MSGLSMAWMEANVRSSGDPDGEADDDDDGAGCFFMFFISFSNFMAFPMSPLIFILPIMKAVVGFTLPANMSTNMSDVITKVTSLAPEAGSPCPAAPEPFFKSKCQMPFSESKQMPYKIRMVNLF